MKPMKFTETFAHGLIATLTVSMDGVSCRWDPELPKNLPQIDREPLVAAYRQWRDSCLQRFAERNKLAMHTITRDGTDAIVFRRTQ